MPSAHVASSTPAHATSVPPTSPTTAPITPTPRPCRATSERCERAEAPMRRSSAMRRVRPAMTVAKVFAVTMAATYTATPMSRKLMIESTAASMLLIPRYGSARSTAAMNPVALSRIAPNALEMAATRMLAPMPRSRSQASGAAGRHEGVTDAAGPGIRPVSVSALTTSPPRPDGRWPTRREPAPPRSARTRACTPRSPRRSGAACRRRCARRRGTARGRRGRRRPGRA